MGLKKGPARAECWEGWHPEILTKEKQRVGRASEDSIQLGESTSPSGPGLSALGPAVEPASRGGTQDTRGPLF